MSSVRGWRSMGAANAGTPTYKYDEENRLISVGTPIRSDGRDYQYDAEARRVLNTYQATEYLYDLGGHAITLLTSGTPPLAWKRGEVFAGGRHVATYTGASGTTNFAHADWLGTERTRTDVTGADITADHWTSLPFGDGASNTANPSALHFTGRTGCGKRPGLLRGQVQRFHHGALHDARSVAVARLAARK